MGSLGWGSHGHGFVQKSQVAKVDFGTTPVSARAPVRSVNPDWLPDSAGRVAGSPRTWKVRP
eukprot:64724-Prymnesium_polylepis.1